MAITICPECNGTISDTVGQCVHCGAKITVCPSCHKVNVGNARFCAGCGHSLNVTTAQPTQPTSNTQINQNPAQYFTAPTQQAQPTQAPQYIQPTQPYQQTQPTQPYQQAQPTQAYQPTQANYYSAPQTQGYQAKQSTTDPFSAFTSGNYQSYQNQKPATNNFSTNMTQRQQPQQYQPNYFSAQQSTSYSGLFSDGDMTAYNAGRKWESERGGMKFLKRYYRICYAALEGLLMIVMIAVLVSTIFDAMSGKLQSIMDAYTTLIGIWVLFSLPTVINACFYPFADLMFLKSFSYWMKGKGLTTSKIMQNTFSRDMSLKEEKEARQILDIAINGEIYPSAGGLIIAKPIITAVGSFINGILSIVGGKIFLDLCIIKGRFDLDMIDMILDCKPLLAIIVAIIVIGLIVNIIVVNVLNSKIKEKRKIWVSTNCPEYSTKHARLCK
ncbi:MAG: zinc ribbon domain-containing protein [Clostridia bacterium]|nr:zinc ribbon domain-containing protein [Clostridia bacterium]